MKLVRNRMGQVIFRPIGLYSIFTLQYNFKKSKQENSSFNILPIVLKLFSLATSRGVLFYLFFMYLSAPLINNLLTTRVFPYSTDSMRAVLPSLSWQSKHAKLLSDSKKATIYSLFVQPAQCNAVLFNWSRLLMSIFYRKYTTGSSMFLCAARWIGLRPDLVVSWQFAWCYKTRYSMTSRCPLYDAQSRAVNPSLFWRSIHFLIYRS